jgi:hypothetical protein
MHLHEIGMWSRVDHRMQETFMASQTRRLTSTDFIHLPNMMHDGTMDRGDSQRMKDYSWL